MSILAYLREVNKALNGYNAQVLSELLSLSHSHVSNPRLQIQNPEQFCQSNIHVKHYDEMFAAHLKSCWALSQDDHSKAFACQLVCIQSFVKALQADKDDNWALPIMYGLILDLKYLASKVETTYKTENTTYEKAADSIMSCFRVCASDGRAAKGVSKKWGMMFLVNQLFKIYFKIGNLHLCKPLIRAIDSSTNKDEFPLAQQVTYKYYVGRKAMFDSNYVQADEHLSFAYENCHKQKRNNLRSILIFLVPVKMLLGKLPPLQLLEDHNLHQFADVSIALKNGNLKALNAALTKHEKFFIHTGTYLIIEKLKSIAFRTLFRKVHLILGSYQIPLKKLVSVLETQGIDDIDIEETECIAAGLIFSGKIRGYISHQHKTMVVSKVNAFPSVSSIPLAT